MVLTSIPLIDPAWLTVDERWDTWKRVRALQPRRALQPTERLLMHRQESLVREVLRVRSGL
jgi:hypothetical protein